MTSTHLTQPAAIRCVRTACAKDAAYAKAHRRSGIAARTVNARRARRLTRGAELAEARSLELQYEGY